MKYTGQLVTGDFEDNTMTFEIEGEMVLQAGKYSIEQIESGEQKKQATTPNANQQRELLVAFAEHLYAVEEQFIPSWMIDNFFKVHNP